MPIIFPGGSGSAGTNVVQKVYLNKPAGNITRAATTVGAFSTPWQITGVVVGSGQNVLLQMEAATSTSGSGDPLFCILRGASQIATLLTSSGAASGRGIALTWVDENPGAGTYTYEVQAAQFTGGTLTVFQTNPTTDVTGGTSIFVATVYIP